MIGEAVSKALGDRAGIQRYGSAMIPFDETLTRVSVDASNRPYLVWKVGFSRPKLGEMDTELFKEWFQAFAQSAGLTLHIENLYGDNNHHICSKAASRGWHAPCGRRSRSIRAAPARSPRPRAPSAAVRLENKYFYARALSRHPRA